MLKIAAFALCLAYFACVLAGVPLAGPRIAPWFLSALSALFVWCYRAKKILQANWLWVLRFTGRQAQVTANVSV
jgi:hypothetical protein